MMNMNMTRPMSQRVETEIVALSLIVIIVAALPVVLLAFRYVAIVIITVALKSVRCEILMMIFVKNVKNSEKIV
jgi:hypothetical protein